MFGFDYMFAHNHAIFSEPGAQPLDMFHSTAAATLFDIRYLISEHLSYSISLTTYLVGGRVLRDNYGMLGEPDDGVF